MWLLQLQLLHSSRQQHCSTWPHYVWLSFSMSLDEPSRKTFSSPKNARGWQWHCKEASSGSQPAEQEGEQQCHVHVSIHGDLLGHILHWTNLIFVCRGDWVLGWESFQTIYSHCSRAAVPGLLSLSAGYCWRLLQLLTSVKAAPGKQSCTFLNDL